MNSILELILMTNNNLNVHFITISKDYDNQRIDNFLITKFKRVPKSMIYRLLRKGEVRVNKKKVQPKYKLQNTDEVRIPPIRQSNIKHFSIPLDYKKILSLNKAVLYEDEYFLILNKPTAIAVHGGSGLKFGIIESLRALRPNNNFLELVHRLDKDTSGILVIAKKRSTLINLHEQLRTQMMQKDYIALVHGHWKPYKNIISAPLIKNILTSGERIVRVSNQGKPSETHFKIEEYFKFATLIKIRPITGRTHQIRVHTQYAGHPIVFDNRYGNHLFDKQLENCSIKRLFLHAFALNFTHPASGEKFYIEAPLDDSLLFCLNYLRNHY